MKFILQLPKELSALTHAIRALTEQMKADACRKSRDGFATKQDLQEMEKRMADNFANWAAENGPKLVRIQSGIDRAQALIEKLQTSPGTFTPADQATADQLQKVLDDIGADADTVPTPPSDPVVQ